MLFPETAKQKIAETFYDKDITILRRTAELDEEGGLKQSGYTPKSTLKGNVCFLTFDEKQAEKGLVLEADVRITCSAETEISVDDLIEYRGERFTVIEVLPYDSHKSILGKRWRA